MTLQIGLEQSEMVVFVMSQKALDAIIHDKFKIGADAGIAVATLGSNVEGATTAAAGADIVSWASSSGAYAGITLEGSLIKPRDSYNKAYYGQVLTAGQIVLNRAAQNPGADALRNALAER